MSRRSPARSTRPTTDAASTRPARSPRTRCAARQPIDGGARLTFDDAPGVRARLETYVAAESKCCPFLTLDLNAADGALVLDVTGPADAAPIIEELFVCAAEKGIRRC